MTAHASLERLTASPAATRAAAPGERLRDVSEALAAFQTVRPRLFGIAYRIVGRATEADDVVQDTWIRWQGADRSQVREPAAFLATTTTRLAINVTRSARARHETHLGPRLPEPVDIGVDPALGAERREALELAVLMLLERLSPPERAAYVLREAFDYPYRHISEVLAVSEANARQLVTRARAHLCGDRRQSVSATERRRLLQAIVGAAAGELAPLERLLTDDVLTYAGEPVQPARLPIVERPHAARPPADVAA